MAKNRKIRRKILEQYESEDDEDLNILYFGMIQVLNFTEREWYVLPRSTHWRQFIFSSQHFLDCQFQNSFRMTRHSFSVLHSMLQPHIQKKQTHLRPTIPSELRLAIFLYHVVQGAAYTSVSDQFAVGKSTISVIIGNVARAIVSHLSARYIRFSTMDEAMRSMEYWRAKTGIPGVVACIDGSHIPILQPANSGSAYCNRKGYYSINVQGTTYYDIDSY